MKQISQPHKASSNSFSALHTSEKKLESVYPTERSRYIMSVCYGALIRFIRRLLVENKQYEINRFKMVEPKFAQQLNIQQTIKYGAVLYITVAMIAIPIGVCDSSYHMAAYEYQVLAPPGEHQPLNGPVRIVQDPKKQLANKKKKADDPNAPPFHNHILKASRAYEVDPTLIRAIIMAESSYNPRAVSHRGAQGLMQLMPTTAKWLGVEDAFDPALNIDGGVRYFRQLLDRFDGDVELALAAYNAGSRYVRKYNGVPPFKATKIYIKKVLRYQKKYQKEMALCKNRSIMS